MLLYNLHLVARKVIKNEEKYLLIGRLFPHLVIFFRIVNGLLTIFQ